MEVQESYFFLLGGHDLEMIEIRKLLETNGFKEKIDFIDNNLVWGAKLSDYLNEFHPTRTNVCIELTEDIAPPPKYLKIDHHNELSHLPSSIEQIATLIGATLTKYQQIVAANDSGYIPAMKAMNATELEIEQIRRSDRQAQGVTEEMEKIAEEETKNATYINNIRVIKTSLSKFSTLADRVYQEQRLLIYNNSSLNYYGLGCRNIVAYYKDSLLKEKKAYSGGKGQGFFGIGENALSVAELEKVKDKIIEIMDIKSYHIFLFPFTFIQEKQENKTPLEQMDLLFSKDNWNLIEKDFCESTERYNQHTYFHDFAEKAMLGSKENEVLKQYEYKKEKLGTNPTFQIKTIQRKDDPYVLHVDEIGLTLYETGVGILSLYLQNRDYDTLEDMRIINNRGRRIFPPFLEIPKNQGDTNTTIPRNDQISDEIQLLGFVEDFKQFDNLQNLKGKKIPLPAHIKGLLGSKLSDCIKPIIDDRMYVVCWYGSNDASINVKTTQNFINDEWYQCVFLDESTTTCQSSRLMQELLQQSTYDRWLGYGTLFGISRYSFVMLTDRSEYAQNKLLTDLKILYNKMAQLCLVQRASTLHFSERIKSAAKANPVTAAQVNDLCLDYIKFNNRIFLREVTSQDQGIELYDKIQKIMRIREEVLDLDREVNELNDIAVFMDTKQQNETLAKITKYGFPLGIASLLLSIFGFIGLDKFNDFIKSFSQTTFGYYPEKPFVIWIIFLFYILIISGLTYSISKRLINKK